MLAFLAANAECVGLTAMVSEVHFRHPAMLVKAVTTLDVLSGGRAWLGAGSRHYEEETRGLGIPSRRRGNASRCSRRRSR